MGCMNAPAASVCVTHKLADATARFSASFTTILLARWRANEAKQAADVGSERMASVALAGTSCVGCIRGLWFFVHHHSQDSFDDPIGDLIQTQPSYLPCRGQILAPGSSAVRGQIVQQRLATSWRPISGSSTTRQPIPLSEPTERADGTATVLSSRDAQALDRVTGIVSPLSLFSNTRGGLIRSHSSRSVSLATDRETYRRGVPGLRCFAVPQSGCPS